MGPVLDRRAITLRRLVLREAFTSIGWIEGSAFMPQTSGLTVRQHERQTIDLRVEFVVGDEHREQVRFSPTSNAAEPFVTRGTASDISPGGMGMVGPQFIPRMCDGSVRIFDPRPTGTGPDGTPILEVVFEHRAGVRRVVLDSHEPTYALGVEFVDPVPDIADRVSNVLALVGTAPGTAPGSPPRNRPG